jgi:hypothetical protein
VRFSQLAGLAVLATMVGIAPALAQPPDFVGRWSAEITIILESQGQIVEVNRDWVFVIERVDGGHVRGYHAWRAKSDDPGYVEDVSVLAASEPFLGVVSSNGKTLLLVEIGDYGLMFCKRIGPDELEISYMEAAPHAVAFAAIVRRERYPAASACE